MTSTRTADPSRAGALWVTATGALLVFAAAVVFVAVRWDQIPDGVKLGALGALSGSLLMAGRTIRSTPVTARILYQLGAFLVPVTGAAVLVHLDVAWESGLGLGGAAGALLLWGLSRAEPPGAGSTVLEHGAAAMAAAATIGLAAALTLPAPLLLAAGAATALALRAERLAFGWALTAAAAPLAAFGVGPADGSSWVAIAESVTEPPVPAALAGLVAGSVLFVLAHRRSDLTPALFGLVAPVLSTAAPIAEAGPAGDDLLVGAAGLFVLVEIVALLARRDRFWARPTDGAAVVTEVGAGAALLAATFLGPLFALAAPSWIHSPVGAALLVGGAGWLLADVRRVPTAAAVRWRTAGWPTAAALAVVTLAAGTVVLLPPTGAAVAILALASAAGIARRPGMTTVALVLIGVAPALAVDDPAIATSAALLGAVVAVAIAIQRARAGVGRWSDNGLAVVPLLTGSAVLIGLVSLVVLGPLCVLALALASAGLDRAGPPHGWIGRVAMLGVLGVVAVGSDPAAIATTAWMLLAVVLVEALRLSDPIPLFGAIPSVPLLCGSLMVLAGWSESGVGLGLTVVGLAVAAATAAVPAGASGRDASAPRPAEGAAWAVAIALLGPGLTLSALDPTRFGFALTLCGLVAAATGARRRSDPVLVAGSALATLGAWTLASAEEVEILAAYAWPLGVTLILAGARLASDRSSWLRFGPGLLLVVGAPLAERLGGGPGEQAVAAGLVAAVAVGAGAWWRQAAPLLLGSATLVTLAVFESLAVTAGVPTWLWLASGGGVLIGAGVLMERAEQGPVETGRRITDALSTNFG